MAMIPFHAVAGARAIEETRSVTIPDNGPVPADSYAFIEFFCDDPACDCRRVIFQVWRQSTGDKIWATITYGWESPDYYAQWSHQGPGPEADEMASATLEQLSPQTELSAPLLELFTELLLDDPAYVERLKRHYHETCPRRMRLDAPRHPSGKVLRRMRERQRKR